MNYSKDKLRQIFQQPFDQQGWQKMLQHYFHATELKAKPELIEATADDEQGYYLGTIDTTDNYRIGLFYYHVQNGNVARKRVGLRKLVKSFVNPNWGEFDAALTVFDSGTLWRLSFVCDIKGESTAPRRYTYVFGENENYYNTPVGRFDVLQRNGISFENIKEAFSVEALTKEFYNDLFNWFQWAVNPESGIYFPNNTDTPEDDLDDIEKKIIRLITRLMFVWFIKQKGLVPDTLFEEKDLSDILLDFDPISIDQGNYYNAILQNLFFATLNRAIEDEEGQRGFATLQGQRDVKTLYRYAEMFKITKDEILQLFSEVPFLNGGLFECLDKTKKIDGVEKAYNYDGFSRNDSRFPNGRYRQRAFIPNIFFFHQEKGILNILKRYNFTIEENTPTEQQVALDPELLGKVFENLLGAYNPETKETARKQSGSFYTPREIVDYMVDKSLIAYLGDTPLVRSMFKDDFTPDELHWSDYQMIAGKLKSIKVIDPACGSGAFPMGLLNRIVDLLQKIETDKTTYELKLNIIENCIYGIDIQSIATQISKLRFFISLICDFEKDASKPNFGIPPLPNLETKFVTANTLVKLKKIKEGEFTGTLFENPNIKPTKIKLARVRHEHFLAKTASAKSRLRKEDKELREQLVKLLSDNNDYAPEDAKQLAAWNPYDQNAVSPFFDMEWMFGVIEGFDIVIGNPPYLRIQGIRESDSVFADYLINHYKSATGSFDLYVTFAEKGLSLVNHSGFVNFIMPTKWTNSAFGKGLRKLISEKEAACEIINFGAYQVFNASTYTGLQWFKPNSKVLKYHELDKDLISNEELKQYLDSLSNAQATIISSEKLSESQWVLTNNAVAEILDRLEQQPRRIKDVFDKIFQGLATSKDDVYFLYDCFEDGECIIGESKQLGRKVQIEKGLVKPLLKGEDVHKYDAIRTNRYVIFPYLIQNGKAILYTEEELSNLYPLGHTYLKECEDVLRDRENGRLKNDEFWYRYIYPKNLTLFDNEKLVAPEISYGGNFAYDFNGEFYSTTKIYGYIKNKEVVEGYKFWLALFNSRLFWFFIQNTGYVLRGGYYTFKTDYINPFPVPNTDANCRVQGIIEQLVDYIVYLNDSGNSNILSHTSNKRISSHIEEIVDMVVYELYFEQHMKDKQIDVVSFLNKYTWDNGHKDIQKEIESFYLWYQQSENPIRQRIMLLETRSKDLLYQIHTSYTL
ncbi:MAG: Eco57I restriction-modification methylase domain-containing protein [Paludibacteraceae bacterium]|nr:Eco57I restriction-modification methylase domain-containing protein [Paludibacteraceae bacterium]